MIQEEQAQLHQVHVKVARPACCPGSSIPVNLADSHISNSLSFKAVYGVVAMVTLVCCV